MPSGLTATPIGSFPTAIGAPAVLVAVLIGVTVPLAALERVDVLGDGASAIYGSDAVAGVVNLVMRRDFVGWETTPYYGFTTGGGGRELGLSQLAGNCWPSKYNGCGIGSVTISSALPSKSVMPRKRSRFSCSGL